MTYEEAAALFLLGDLNALCIILEKEMIKSWTKSL